MLVGCFVHVLACGANTYSAAGAGGCTGCPANSQSGAGASTCVCNAGYGTSGSGSSLSCPGTPYDFGIEPDAAHADERERMTSFRFLSACPAGQTSVAGGACTSKLAVLSRMNVAVRAALSPFKPARCFISSCRLRRWLDHRVGWIELVLWSVAGSLNQLSSKFHIYSTSPS